MQGQGLRWAPEEGPEPMGDGHLLPSPRGSCSPLEWAEAGDSPRTVGWELPPSPTAASSSAGTESFGLFSCMVNGEEREQTHRAVFR